MKSFSLAALTLLMFAQPAFALNPVGDGSLSLDANTEVVHPSVQAQRWNQTSIEQYGQQQQDLVEWGVSGTMPLGQPWAIEADGHSSHGTWVDSVSNTRNHSYDIQGSSQSLSLAFTGQCRVATLFGHEWDPRVDHPEGPCLWPVLEPSFSWSQTTDSWQVLDTVGYTVTLGPSATVNGGGAGCLVLLPLTRSLAVLGSYGENLWTQVTQGSTTANSSFGSASWLLGASWSLRWQQEDTALPYFPGLGRPGCTRLRVEWSGQWSLQQGEQLSRGYSVSATTPFASNLSLLVGWNTSTSMRGALDGMPGLISQQPGPDPQHLYATLSLSFGDASKP